MAGEVNIGPIDVSPHHLQRSAEEVRLALESTDQNVGLVLQVMLYNGWYMPGRLVDEKRFEIAETIPLASTGEDALKAGFDTAREKLGQRGYGRPIKYQVDVIPQPSQS